MAYQKPVSDVDRAVAELQRHWPVAAVGNLGEGEEATKAANQILERAAHLAAAADRDGQSIAQYASSLLWSAHLMRRDMAANAHGMVVPLALVLDADPMAGAA